MNRIISVGIITYNQEKTIRQTLESVLCQKGDFDLELVVGEDHSLDATRSICEEYASKYPMHTDNTTISFVLLDDQPNLGIMRNFARVMKACTGDYIGICAGDDYWCDDYASGIAFDGHEYKSKEELYLAVDEYIKEL